MKMCQAYDIKCIHLSHVLHLHNSDIIQKGGGNGRGKGIYKS